MPTTNDPLHPFSLSVQEKVSFVLVATLCFLALWQGLLPGVLATCLGFGMVRAASQERGAKKWRLLPPWLAATVVICLPVAGLLALGLNAKAVSLLAVDQYRDLADHLAKTVLELKSKLPEELAKNLPQGTEAAQAWVALQLKTQAAGLATAGKAWLHGALLAYVGLVIGSLIGAQKTFSFEAPLSKANQARALAFMDAFWQIVAAQFWIAAFNTTLTGIFIFGVLPAFDVHMPYATALVVLTFVAGLIPIVGNLFCNVVVTIVGLSVSPLVGASCLAFLIGIHKFEYFINAKVVGSRTKTSAWELLAAMFIGETLFGIPGLVAAPLYYAYAKKELKALGWV